MLISTHMISLAFHQFAMCVLYNDQAEFTVCLVDVEPLQQGW